MKLEKKITGELMAEDRLLPGAWEIKRTKTNSIAFSSFAVHQITALFKAKLQRLHVKIRDVGVFKKEFDGITLEKSPAWCICCYPDDNRKGYVAYAIDVGVWHKERQTCGRKSLTKERANELGEEI